MDRPTIPQQHACSALAMARRGLARLVSLAVLGACCGASAQALEQIDFSAQRAQVIAQLDRVPELELRQRHLRCVHVASVRALTIGETTICALVANALRERSFAGDHLAMTAWVESRRDVQLSLLEP